MNQKQEKQMANAVGETCGRPHIAGKTQKGITLIALVITIIVLLILAGVTINMVLGEDGIIQNAQKAKNLNKDGQIEEALDLLRAEVKMAEHGLEPENLLPTKAEEVITRLKDKGLVEPGELEKKGLQTIGYTDETKTKTFSLEGIVKWDNSQAGDFIISDDGIITSYTGEGVTNVIIPEEIDGVKVTGIGGGVFAYSDLTSIQIPDSVTSIGAGAFCGCSSLTSITIPEGVTSLGEAWNELLDNTDGVFSHCDSLTNVKLPNSLTSIGAYTFYGSTVLKSINIPESVTEIGAYAFLECDLSSITIPDSVKSIGKYAFEGCSYLTSITIPDSVTSIGDGAFIFCGFSSIIIPDSVTSIGSSLFSGCYNLTSVVLPEGLTNIPDGLFCETGLTSYDIPESVTSIGDEAFRLCYNLTSITIPSNVTSIGDWAFEWCESLRSITIEGTITTLGSGVFEEVPEGCEILYQGETYSSASFEALFQD